MDMKGKYYNYSTDYMDAYDVTFNKSSNYDYMIRGKNRHLDRNEYTKVRKKPKYWNNY